MVKQSRTRYENYRQVREKWQVKKDKEVERAIQSVAAWDEDTCAWGRRVAGEDNFATFPCPDQFEDATVGELGSGNSKGDGPWALTVNVGDDYIVYTNVDPESKLVEMYPLDY